jgi:hypothetical protein
MLSLDKPRNFDGVTVFSDHADKNLFWYLSGPVQLARRPESNRAAFSFIKYKPAVAGAGVKGGGFAMFETTLALTEGEKNRILGAVLTEPGVTQPRLAPVIFETGSVQCMALNLQGSGGAVAVDPPPGAFNAVQQILGATTPAMDADNRAAFSLTLSQEGAIILEQAFEDGLAPIGVLYTFTYSGLRPALEVEIKADLEMIFNHFSASLEAQYQWVRAGIDAAFETLKQTGAIKIKVISFTGEADEKEQEDWALAFFKDDLLAKWFEPTFTPGQLASAAAQSDPLAEVAKFTREALRGEKPAEGDGKTGGADGKTGGADGKTGGADGKTGGAGGQTGAAGGQAGGTGGQTGGVVGAAAATVGQVAGAVGQAAGAVGQAAGAVGQATGAGGTAGGAQAGAQPQRQVIQQPAALTTTSTSPSPLPQGRSVTHTPATTGTRETVTVTGAGAVVKAGGVAQTLNQQGQFTVDVAPEASVPIEVDWPAATQEQTFNLFFDFDEPTDDAEVRQYVANNTGDARFKLASGIAQAGGTTLPTAGEGAARLTAWLATLAPPKTVEADAHASFETQPQPGSSTAIFTGNAQLEHNMKLSKRRADVAEALIARAGVSFSTRPRANGDRDARAAAASKPATGDPNDRVVRIKGLVAGGATSSFRGTLARPRSTVIEPPKPPVTPDKPETPKEKPPEQKPSTMPGVVSLQLKFVRQEERKKLTFYYNRAEATRRTYAPQGFFGLLLGDLDDRDSYFTEVDLDDPFFREFKVQAEAPIDFARIGLSSAQVALDYGDPADAEDHKHGDFVFRADDKGPKEFAVFLNATRDVDYAQQQQFHFSPDAGWDSDRSSVELPAVRTEDRTLFINPFDVLDFLEIAVTPGDIDTGIVQSIEATLEATGPGAFSKRKTFVVLADSAPQVWKLRAPKPAPPETRTVTVALKHHLKDGTVRETPPAVVEASAVVVHDPFDQALNIEFVPLFDAAAVRQVFIDVEYDDPANSYSRVERLDVPGSQTGNVKLRLALLDPEQRQFRFRFTVVGTGGEFRRLAFETSDEEIVPIQV